MLTRSSYLFYVICVLSAKRSVQETGGERSRHRPAGNSQEHPGGDTGRKGTGQYISSRGPLVYWRVSMPANLIPLTNGSYEQNTMAVKTLGKILKIRFTVHTISFNQGQILLNLTHNGIFQEEESSRESIDMF